MNRQIMWAGSASKNFRAAKSEFAPPAMVHLKSTAKWTIEL
jgi:hypothetical protein